MITLKQVRLINWYAFIDETAPIGLFTLIAGKNGNGKSVLLDAIKYAAFGDTVFNKSSESKGSRTLSSYTRGLLDATAGTYMRPAERQPVVITHIALEYYDDTDEKSFVLGAVIETNASNNCQTWRYDCNRSTLAELPLTKTENGTTVPCTASELQKACGLRLMNREQGLQRFMQMTGLRLGLAQIPQYLRKLRGIMSYDPDAKVDRFIRESVLEDKTIDFTKLIEAKENIDRLKSSFRAVDDEIQALDAILAKWDEWDSYQNRLLADDIKQNWQRKTACEEEIKARTEEQMYCGNQAASLTEKLRNLEKQLTDTQNRLLDAKDNLRRLDCMKMIEEEEKRLSELQEEKRLLESALRELEDFQRKLSEILAELSEETGVLSAEERRTLSSLCSDTVSAADKEYAVQKLRGVLEQQSTDKVKKLGLLEQAIYQTDEKISHEEAIAEECRKHRNAYTLIPDWVGLRNEINEELARRNIESRAQFACDYVLSLRDESWRDALEAFLGQKRYTILVDPSCYEIADEVMNASRYRYAHLFNTKLLMTRKSDEIPDDSAVHLLEIRNPIAQKYFDYQLGRMHAVELSEVKRYENAISREGRVALAMDGWFLDFKRIRAYYLGQESFELNRIRAERESERLRKEREKQLAERNETEAAINRIKSELRFFRSYRYDASTAYQKASQGCTASEKRLRSLKAAQKNNREFLELSAAVEALTAETGKLRLERDEQGRQQLALQQRQQRCGEIIEEKSAELERVSAVYHEYEISAYPILQKAVEAYRRYLANGKTGQGGMMQPQSRERIRQQIEKARTDLLSLEAAYLARHAESGLEPGTDQREQYAGRRERIWMDDLQEIEKKLDEQTHRYEDIFKNEFVLTVLKSCEKAREDLRSINIELSRLNFEAKYQFDVNYVRDGSAYEQIIKYAKMIDEREQLGGGEGQNVLGIFNSYAGEEEKLEAELKKVIDRLISSGNTESIAGFADYRNYMSYEILITNKVLDRARLSRQTGYNSGAEVQIPYLLILSSALLMIYNQKPNSARLVFIDEPFAKMDPGNVRLMLDFMRSQRLQVIFCSPDKTESIGNACDVILPVLRLNPGTMKLGIVQFHETAAAAG